MNFKITNYKPILSILSILIGSIVFLYFSILNVKIDCGSYNCMFEVFKNENAYQVAYRLDEANIINEPNSFLIASKVMFLDKLIKPGKYDLSKISSLKELIYLLTDPGYDYISITIPEGWAINQIANKLKNNNLADSVKFDSLCTDYEFIVSLGFQNINSLEGYLFPNTYFISSSQNEQEIIEMMVQEFKMVIKSQNLDFKKYGFSFHNVLTLASIIQGEAMHVDEMDIISSVFHNRLNKNMFLDANATIQYIVPGKNRRLMNKDLLIDHPYNTYKYKGLPPGPINNPGLDAIIAACKPLETNYIYFVKNPDNSGKHVFNKTFKDHERSRLKYLRSLK